jgi:hypothetical protein
MEVEIYQRSPEPAAGPRWKEPWSWIGISVPGKGQQNWLTHMCGDKAIRPCRTRNRFGPDIDVSRKFFSALPSKIGGAERRFGSLKHLQIQQE